MIIIPRLMNPRGKPDGGGTGRSSAQSGSGGARGEREARLACREYLEALAERSGLMRKDYSAIVASPLAQAAGLTAETLLTLWQGQVRQVFDTFVDANWPKFDTALTEAQGIADAATVDASADAAFAELMRIVDEEIAKVIRERAQTLDA
jgi:hypothetical protein